MKIAVLSAFYPSTIIEDNVGAPNRRKGHPFPWIRNLAEALAKIPDNNVHVVSLNTQFDRDMSIDKGKVTYHFLKRSGRLLKGFTLAESERWTIQRFLSAEHFDILHGQGFDAYGYYAATTGSANVVTIHLYFSPSQTFLPFHGESKDLNYLFDTIVSKMNRMVLFRNLKNVISISPYLTAELRKDGYRGKIYPIENPVASSFFADTEWRDESFGLYVGSINARKSVIDLLAAAKLCPDIRLKFISYNLEGEYVESFFRYIKENNLNERVEVLGMLENEKVADVLNRCSFLVLPSRMEMAPLVISEAMAAGKPVIATKAGGIPYMVRDGETGYLVEAGDVIQLSQRMKHLLSQKELCKAMGMRGKDEARYRWHPDAVAETTTSVYHKLLDL